jgi:hypothetical protein
MKVTTSGGFFIGGIRELTPGFLDAALTKHCSEIIAAVTVKDYKFVNFVTVQQINNLAEFAPFSNPTDGLNASTI